ncbi:hypothetical protein P5673_022472 [Acropora cervicornis]|uniref:Uncharacterized protein n=1 Tax=Acropora cervicornis TaxID=6130 RepID=A0AAD9Q7K0_ACRCE|nr:hypothetical protein P5673_022472 [Acropora cervicornis]
MEGNHGACFKRRATAVLKSNEIWLDSTAADSSVVPNTIAPNSLDQTNHPSSGISPFKMAKGDLSKDPEKFVLFKTISNARRHRKWLQQSILNTVIARRRLLVQVSSFIFLLVYFNGSQQQFPAGAFKRTFVGGTQFGTRIV